MKIFSKNLLLFMLAMGFAWLPFKVMAQRISSNTPVVTSELVVSAVVKQTNGEDKLTPVQAVKPGDLLQYTVNYKNNSKQAVTHLVATLPIPAETEYESKTAFPAGVLASLDGKIFAPAPLLRQIKKPDGKLLDVPVPLSEYRFLRWPGRELAAGASFSASARVQVISAAIVSSLANASVPR